MVCAGWLAAALSGCSGGEVPLAANQLAANPRSADYPRARLGSLPVVVGERTFEGRCGIELVQGANITELKADNSFRVDQPASASGWAFPPDDVVGIPEAWLRWVPVAAEGTAAEFPIVLHSSRPDVVAARTNERAAFSGFTGVAVSGLAAGSYDVQVVFASDDGRWVCAHSRRVILK